MVREWRTHVATQFSTLTERATAQVGPRGRRGPRGTLGGRGRFTREADGPRVGVLVMRGLCGGGGLREHLCTFPSTFL